MAATITAPQPTAVWPCLPGCVTSGDHTMPLPDRSCAVQTGGPAPWNVEARRDRDTGAVRVELAGQHGPTHVLTPGEALALAAALADAVAVAGSEWAGGRSA